MRLLVNPSLASYSIQDSNNTDADKIPPTKTTQGLSKCSLTTEKVQFRYSVILSACLFTESTDVDNWEYACMSVAHAGSRQEADLAARAAGRADKTSPSPPTFDQGATSAATNTTWEKRKKKFENKVEEKYFFPSKETESPARKREEKLY